MTRYYSGIAIIVNYKGKLYCIVLNPTDPHRAAALPGGTQDPGETFVDTAIRETKEECGIIFLKIQLRTLGKPTEVKDQVAKLQLVKHTGLQMLSYNSKISKGMKVPGAIFSASEMQNTMQLDWFHSKLVMASTLSGYTGLLIAV